MKKLRQVEYRSCDYCDTETEFNCQICHKDTCNSHRIIIRIINNNDKEVRAFSICREHLDKKALKFYDEESKRDYKN